MSVVFVGQRWSLETRGASGYVTCAITAKTKAYDDPSYPSAVDLVVPPRIEQRIRKMMRENAPQEKDSERLETLVKIFDTGDTEFAEELFFARQKRKTELGAFRLALDNYKERMG